MQTLTETCAGCRRAIIIGWLVALAFAAPALAQGEHPPGDRPSTQPIVWSVVDVAESFWQARNVPVCPLGQLEVREADDLSAGMSWEHAYGRGELGGCRIWLLSSLVIQAEAGAPGNEAAIYLCRTAVLEVAHTGGLDDAYGSGGVLDPAADWKHGTPWDCRAWAAEQRRSWHRAARRFMRLQGLARSSRVVR